MVFAALAPFGSAWGDLAQQTNPGNRFNVFFARHIKRLFGALFLPHCSVHRSGGFEAFGPVSDQRWT